MADHESPIQLNVGGGTLAKQIVASEQDHVTLPDGVILASGVRRVVAFTVDVVIITTILMIATGGRLIDAWNLTLWGSVDFHFALAHALILLVAHWLYWRLTGLAYSRSLGQRLFGLAVIAEDGSALTSEMWDSRSLRKLLLLIPLLNIYVGAYELARISQRHTHQTNVDVHVGSIVAHSDS
ncbi:MAG: RDD family protein, partial [Candidatus Thermoplasmatota archaeon]|nr:RDD family protein [Candidatus Thermoplasmatota archaeon]